MALTESPTPDLASEQSPHSSEGGKTCCKCKRDLPRGAFGIKSSSADCLRARCKECRREDRAAVANIVNAKMRDRRANDAAWRAAKNSARNARYLANPEPARRTNKLVRLRNIAKIADGAEISSHKFCTGCQKTLPATFEYFHKQAGTPTGLRWICKACVRAAREANHDKHRAWEKKADDKRRDKKNAANREQWAADPELRARGHAANKAWHRENAAAKLASNRKWRAENPDKVREQLSRAYRKDPLRYHISAYVSSSLRRDGLSKGRKSFEKLLGWSISELREHLERQFTGNLSWKNYGSLWEIDHIVPLVSFKFKAADDPDFIAAWSLANLRPLLCTKNRSKGGRREHLL